ncbi:MAG: nucleotidyltransferase domain-containing protein, partial [Anaerolineales bacterium]|nr:nucleotidyltransferase domain-containing protein [Anaerolineales bacterium]
MEKQPLTLDASIAALVERIALRFNPEKIILFGSRAHGEPRPDSDSDILVILPFEGSPLRKAVEILSQTDCRLSVDLIVRTPEEAARRYAQHDPIIREAFDHGIVLYER